MVQIKLDANRNIYDSLATGWQYEANARTMTAYFNRGTGVDWRPCVAIHANPAPPTWGGCYTSGHSITLTLPGTPVCIIDGNKAIYDYGGIEIHFEVLLDRIHRSIVIRDQSALDKLDASLVATLTTDNLTSEYIDASLIEFKLGDEVLLRLSTTRMQDSAQEPLLYAHCPESPGQLCLTQCRSEQCGHSCETCEWNKLRARNRPPETRAETVTLVGDILTLGVDKEWITASGRVFPILINDDVTPVAGSLTGFGGWATNTGNLVDGDPATHAGTTCITTVDPLYANNYVNIDLGKAYRIDHFCVENDAGLCSTPLDTGSGDWYCYRLTYRDNGSYVAFSPECVICVPDATSPNSYFQTERTSNDISGQGVCA